MTDGPATATRRRSRLQFSLRLLLFAFTAFAIGFPIWHRWPYEEVEWHYPTKQVNVPGKLLWEPDKSKPPHGRTTKTFRRSWGSLTPELSRTELEQFSPPGRKFVMHYQNGLLDGHYEEYLDGQLVREGQYERGKCHGAWARYRGGALVSTAHWHQGRLDGLYEQRSPINPLRVLFARGRIVHRNGQPIENLLFDRMESGAIDLKRIVDELRKPVPIGFEFVETPLIDAVQFLQDQHRMPLQLDVLHVPDVNAPITADYGDLDLCSTLTLLFEPRGLACDYRYGCLWVTTAEDARNWRDPTGVDQIRPPPGSSLDAAWNAIDPLGIEAINHPLDGVLQGLSMRQAFSEELDVSQVKGLTVTVILKGLPLRYSLGNVLYTAGCRCELTSGKLVVLPPEP